MATLEMTVKPEGYSVYDVIKVVEALSNSQGFYGRLLKDIVNLQENEPEKFEEFKELIEMVKLKDPVEVVMFFEG